MMKLQHCSLVVRDLAKSRWFYGTVLGMEEVARPPNFTFDGAWFRGDESEFHLIAASDTTAPPGFEDPGPAGHTGLATHIALEVTDLSGTKAQLEQYGIEILGGPMPRGDGVVQMYVHDPDGYLIEFFEWAAGGKQEATERGAVRGEAVARTRSSGRQATLTRGEG